MNTTSCGSSPSFFLSTPKKALQNAWKVRIKISKTNKSVGFPQILQSQTNEDIKPSFHVTARNKNFQPRLFFGPSGTFSFFSPWKTTLWRDMGHVGVDHKDIKGHLGLKLCRSVIALEILGSCCLWLLWYVGYCGRVIWDKEISKIISKWVLYNDTSSMPKDSKRDFSRTMPFDPTNSMVTPWFSGTAACC